MIKIMVDSASDCSREDGIFDLHIPLTVSIGGRDYKDGVDLTADEFYKLLTTTEEFPKTSQPSPEVYAEAFEKIKADGDEVICFTISSALSGTYQSATIAKSMVDYDGIYIIDTRMVTHLIGTLASYAAGRIREGLSAAQIVAECEELKTRIKVLAGVDTLEYLYKGGRLSRASATVGGIAGIKPIVTLTEEGTVNASSKAIGMARAMQAVLTKLKSYELDENFPLYTVYTYGSENPNAFEKKLAAAGFTSSGRKQVGPTIGAHVGPGVYGVVFVTKK